MKPRKIKSRLIAMALLIAMVVCALPVNTLAAMTTATDLTIISDKETTLAPGVIQDEVVALDKNGDRVEMFIATIDLSVDTVKVYANYKDNQNEVYGMSTVREQAAAAVAKHQGENYTPVVAINASYYNTSNGKPTGAFVMEGNDVTTQGEGDKYSFFAVLKDGTYMIGAKGEYSKYVGRIQEAIGGYYHIVKAGVNQQNISDKTKYPRQTLGLTADGKLILMTADGNNAPKSIGLTLWEQAQVMIDLGCVEAIHLDGGGSATYTSKPAGSDTLEIVNTPSDGSERSVSNSLMIVSTAVADGTFDSAVLKAENDYVTPNSVVKVATIGVDTVGGPAEIPDDVSWSLEDSAMGTVENGVFTSNGTTGDAVVQLVHNGVVVGKTVIHVVVPTGLRFNSTRIVVPFGKSLKINVVATVNDGANEVAWNDGEIALFLSDAGIGTISGFNFTANDGSSGVTEATITASFVGSDVVGTSTIKLGRGSEIVEDFEDGQFPYQWKSMYNVGDTASVELVTADTGMVRNGQYAMAWNLDFSGYLGYVGRGGSNLMNWELPNVENAVAIGFWMYIPEDANGIHMQFRTFNANTNSTIGKASPSLLPLGYASTLERPGWYYVRASLADLNSNLEINHLQLYVEDFQDAPAYGYVAADQKNEAGKFTIYIDDVTIDYSEAVEDRENPTFEDIKIIYGTNEPVVMNGQTITANEVIVSTKAADFVADNAVGLDCSSAKAFLNGIDITDKLTCSNNGSMGLEKIALPDGTHKFKFTVCDLNGNPASIERHIVVDANDAAPVVTIEPRDPNAVNMLAGSLYWLDVKTTNIAEMSEISTIINLNGLHDWEPEHMVIADGFEASYKVDVHSNDLSLTITRTDKAISDDDTVLVSLPIRTWYKTYSASRNGWWRRSVLVSTNLGLITFADGTTGSFAMNPMDVFTEVNKSGELANLEGVDDLGAWHQHTPVAIADSAATCLTHGYSGQTYCSVCDSVVNWGTKIADATGHNYALTDGVLQCECGKVFNGTYSDGKTYDNGVALNGWVENSYYVDGVAHTGVQLVDGLYYNFGEDGVCANKTAFTGKFYNEAAKGYCYAISGELKNGWHLVDDIWNYFRSNQKTAITGTYKFVSGNCAGITYVFDNEGNLTDGVWHTTDDGKTQYFYGPDCYKWANNMLQEIHGKTYCFDKDGYLYRGYQMIRIGAFAEHQLYHFDEVTGELIKLYDEETGVFALHNGDYCYLVNGVVQKSLGLITVDGAQYYVRGNGLLAVGKFYIGAGYTGCGHLKAGYYDFGEDGKFIGPWVDTSLNGVLKGEDGELHYYVNGIIQKSLGLITVNGAQYYVRGNGLLAVGKFYIGAGYTGCGKLTPGYYDFGEDGKLVGPWIDTSLNGIIADEDGNLRYYVNGVAQAGLGLIGIGNADYYVRGNGLLAVGKFYIGAGYTGCGHLTPGYYDFGKDGKLVGPWVDEGGSGFTGVKTDADGNLHYYVDDVIQKSLGMITVDGAQYYVRGNGLLAVGKYYIGAGYTGCGHLTPGYYDFGEDGKFVGPWASQGGFTGIKAGADGNLHYYVDDVIQKSLGMITVDGAQYYVRGNGLLAVGKYYIGKGYTGCGHLTPGYYDFGEDGKFVGPWTE